MNRRNLIGRLTALVFGYTVFSLRAARGASDSYAVFESDTPHADAISLVIASQKTEVAQCETKYFRDHGVDWWRGELSQYRWHDMITRSWSVTRPIAPGTVDSTHWFFVTYSINGKPVCSWSVDTRKKRADLAKGIVPLHRK